MIWCKYIWQQVQLTGKSWSSQMHWAHGRCESVFRSMYLAAFVELWQIVVLLLGSLSISSTLTTVVETQQTILQPYKCAVLEELESHVISFLLVSHVFRCRCSLTWWQLPSPCQSFTVWRIEKKLCWLCGGRQARTWLVEMAKFTFKCCTHYYCFSLCEGLDNPSQLCHVLVSSFVN